MTIFLYNILIVLLSPFWVPWMILRARKRKEQPNWKERLGEYDIPKKPDRKRVWVHAVSVGEVIATRPILQELRAELPGYEIVLTTTTSTGQEVARPLVGKLVDYLFYYPLDVPRFCVGAMIRVEPSVVAIMETELWPNFLNAAKLTNARTCLVNGRISDRSFPKARRLRFFYNAVLKRVDECFMQTETDAERIRALGAKSADVLGNSKYDEAGAAPESGGWRERMGVGTGEHLIVVGSARGEEEEKIILEGLKDVPARILFAPRHIERADEVAAAARRLGYRTGRRSRSELDRPLVILDTLGELASAYPDADLAVIGGSFVPLGGQNIIQPLAAGCPVVCGPHMRNFREPFEAAVEAGCAVVAANVLELRERTKALLSDKDQLARMAKSGRELVAGNLGAAKRYAIAIAALAREFEAER